MKTLVFAQTLSPVFFKMEAMDADLIQISKEHEEFLDDAGRQLVPFVSHASDLNLSAAYSQINLTLTYPIQSIDPKSSATLAQQYINSSDFIAQLDNLVEFTPTCTALSVKANVLDYNVVQFVSIAPATVKHLAKFFTKKVPFLRRRGIKRRFGKFIIKRFRFITKTELLKYFLWRFFEKTFLPGDFKLAKSTLREFCSLVKALKLVVVNL